MPSVETSKKNERQRCGNGHRSHSDAVSTFGKAQMELEKQRELTSKYSDARVGGNECQSGNEPDKFYISGSGGGLFTFADVYNCCLERGVADSENNGENANKRGYESRRCG